MDSDSPQFDKPNIAIQKLGDVVPEVGSLDFYKPTSKLHV